MFASAEFNRRLFRQIEGDRQNIGRFMCRIAERIILRKSAGAPDMRSFLQINLIGPLLHYSRFQIMLLWKIYAPANKCFA